MNTNSWQQHVNSNRLQTLLLLVVMVGFLALLGALLWGRDGVFILMTLGILMLLFNPTISPALVMRLYRAQPLPPQQAAGLYGALKGLSARAGLDRLPQLFYIRSDTLNAFAVGSHRDAAIGLTDGLLRRLDGDEIVAVLAHEISHISHHDMRVMGLADLFSRLTSLLSLTGQLLLLINLPLLALGIANINWWAIVVLILAPNISALAQLGLSRTREYHADLNAVALTGDVRSLARALVKIDHAQSGWLEQVILPGRNIPDPSLLRSHPPTSERVRRLLNLEQAHSAGWQGDKPVPITRVPRRPPPASWHWNGLWY